LDTKLRRFSTHGMTKFLAFAIVVLALAAVVVQIQYAEYINGNVESLIVDSYIDSEEFYYGQVQNALYRVSRAIEEGEEIEGEPDYVYFGDDGEKTFGNAKWTDREFYEQYDQTFYYLENGDWQAGENANPPRQYTLVDNTEAIAYVAFTDEYMAGKQLDWEENRAVLKPLALRTAASVMLALLFIAYLIWATGRKPDDRELHMAKIDVVYSDVLLALFIPAIGIWVVSIGELPSQGIDCSMDSV